MPQKKGAIPWNKGLKGVLVSPLKGKKNPKMTGELNPSWKGGRWKRKDGYIRVYCPGHPNLTKGRNDVFEHTLVAEKKLGRFLEKGEVVHHINGIRDDNRPENIVVLTASTHIKEHPPRKLITKWSHYHGDQCKNCGTNDRKHYGRGLCRRCFNKKYRPSRARVKL